MQVQIKFLTTGANSAIGAYGTGDTLRCSPEFAKHLVEDAGVAEYVKPAKAEPKVEAEKPTKKAK